jgi:hypothetical protein
MKITTSITTMIYHPPNKIIRVTIEIIILITIIIILIMFSWLW